MPGVIIIRSDQPMHTPHKSYQIPTSHRSGQIPIPSHRSYPIPTCVCAGGGSSHYTVLPTRPHPSQTGVRADSSILEIYIYIYTSAVATSNRSNRIPTANRSDMIPTSHRSDQIRSDQIRLDIHTGHIISDPHFFVELDDPQTGTSR